MRLQGAHESLHRDIMVHLGTWEFDPMEMENQFPNNEESVFYVKVTKTSSCHFTVTSLRSYLGSDITKVLMGVI